MEKIETNQGHLDNGPGLIKVVPGFVGRYVFNVSLANIVFPNSAFFVAFGYSENVNI